VFPRSIYVHLLGDRGAHTPTHEVFTAGASGYDTDNALVCISDSSLGAGPLQICVRNLHSKLRDTRQTVAVGDSVQVNQHERTIHTHRVAGNEKITGIALTYTDASTDASACSIGHPHDHNQNHERTVQHLFRSHQFVFGLAPGLQSSAVRLRSNIALQELRNWLSTSAERVAIAGLDQSMLAELPNSLIAFIGLGEGLTPAGDDYLAGVLIGLRYCARNAAADKLAQYLQEHLKGRTNRISRAHLACVCACHYQTIIVDLLAAFDHRAQHVDHAIRQLIEYGHTSGLDLLAGFSTALKPST
jgi:hypothetical protein